MYGKQKYIQVRIVKDKNFNNITKAETFTQATHDEAYNADDWIISTTDLAVSLFICDALNTVTLEYASTFIFIVKTPPQAPVPYITLYQFPDFIENGIVFL